MGREMKDGKSHHHEDENLDTGPQLQETPCLKYLIEPDMRDIVDGHTSEYSLFV